MAPGSKQIYKTQMQNSLGAQPVKDLALPRQQLWSLLWHWFDPWPGNFHRPQVRPKKKIIIKQKKKKTNPGVPVVVQRVKNWTGIHEDVSLNPGLTLWVKGPALPQAAAQVSDAAQIQCCCGCGVGLWLWLPFNPWPGNLHMPLGEALKRLTK